MLISFIHKCKSTQVKPLVICEFEHMLPLVINGIQCGVLLSFISFCRHNLRRDIANNRRELEPMSRTARAHQNLFRRGIYIIEYKILTPSECVIARLYLVNFDKLCPEDFFRLFFKEYLLVL